MTFDDAWIAFFCIAGIGAGVAVACLALLLANFGGLRPR